MGDFGIRISEADFDVNTALTESNKKDFVYLSDESTPKVYYAGFLEAPDQYSAMTYEHNLGYVPMFFLFLTDSKTSPTYFNPSINVAADTTIITQYPGTYGYLIILEEGSA
mgnify:CR=1 FL=1